MDRRHFFKRTLGNGALAATGLAAAAELLGARPAKMLQKPIAKRPLGKTGEQLSIIGFAGIVVMSVDQSFANNIVAEAVDRGINYFDVSPDYGSAEERLGPALQPYRNRSFLACKTNFRDKAGAMNDLETSLKHLKTDHFDLYQHHALTERLRGVDLTSPKAWVAAFEQEIANSHRQSIVSRAGRGHGPVYESAIRCRRYRLAKPGALERDRYRLLANGDPDWNLEPWRSLKR